MYIVVETFLNHGEPSNAMYRVRPIEGQIYSSSIRVQCSRAMRNAFPLGTKFQIEVELVENKTGAKFLREIGKKTWIQYAQTKIICQFKLNKMDKLLANIDQ